MTVTAGQACRQSSALDPAGLQEDGCPLSNLWARLNFVPNPGLDEKDLPSRKPERPAIDGDVERRAPQVND